jgi:serine/threonine protein kinase
MGVVHRDVKPANLLLDDAGHLWVTDFGLARIETGAGLTMTGDLLGTLRYMAPEQALAKHGLVDHRADVYGLGCTLYELLTLRPAVPGEDKAEILRHIASEEPTGPRKLDKAIPAELETITLKCLAREPSERYTTAGEVAADLRRFLDDQPIHAKPPTVWQRVAKWVRRHRGTVRAMAVVAGLAIVALAVFTAVVLQQRTEISHQRDQVTAALGQAEANLAVATKQRQRAWQAVDDMYTQVAEKWLAGEPGMTDLQREFLDKAVRFYEDLAHEEGDAPE